MASEVSLKRALTLPHAVLYGMGVTVGAGIYVPIGAAAARAGMHAPLAFVIAAILMGLTAASFAELGGRMPVAAGEAAYVRAAFGSDRLSLAAGLLVVAIAVVAAAAISVGRGAIAAWGIKESVTFAGAMTLIEVGGLVLLIAAGALWEPDLVNRLPEMVPPLANPAALVGLIGAALLAWHSSASRAARTRRRAMAMSRRAGCRGLLTIITGTAALLKPLSSRLASP
jgi:amino acid transporter